MQQQSAKIMAHKCRKINPIKVRYKRLKDGSKSIYLDYKVEGRRKSEFLKMYLLPGRSDEVKRLNDYTHRAVANIIAQRMNNLAWDRNANAGVKDSKRLLTEVCTEYGSLRTKRGSKGAKTRYSNLNHHICSVNAHIRMWEVNLDFVKALADTMMRKGRTSTGSPLAKATITNTISALSSVMRYAQRKGMVKENPVELFDTSTIQGPVYKRNYLIADEVKALIDTPCSNEEYKNLFLFGCFVGLRYSDLRTLRWKDIIVENGETRIEKMMSKTKHMVYIPLGKGALQYLPPRRDFDDLVFPDLPYNIGIIDVVIKQWAKDAGIRKVVTFYTARHSFATLSLTQGADLFAVSRLMGHNDISTTEGYAEIIDAKKEANIALIDNMFAEYREKENISAEDNASCNGLMNLDWECKRPMADVIDVAYRYYQSTAGRDLSYFFNLLKRYFGQFKHDMRICDINGQSNKAFFDFLQSEATDEHDRKLCRMKVEDALRTYEDTLHVAIKHSWLTHNYALDIDWFDINGYIDDSEWLSNDELDILDTTPCETPALKEVFLLCCYCNMTHKQAFSLRWKDITTTDDGRKRITLFDPKTSTKSTFSVPLKAVHHLPEPTELTELTDKVFHPISTDTKSINDAFLLWTRSSILERRITFIKYKATYRRIFADRMIMNRR